jgi:hypothetical protein
MWLVLPWRRIIRRILINSAGMAWLIFFPVYKLLFFPSRRQNDNCQGKITVIAQKNFRVPGYEFNGSNKVTESIVAEIEKMGFETSIINATKSLFSSARFIFGERKNRLKIMQNGLVLFSIPGDSGFLAVYLQLIARRRVVYLSHNAELLHRIEWALNIRNPKYRVKYFCRAISGLVSDIGVIFY